LKWLQGLIV